MRLLLALALLCLLVAPATAGYDAQVEAAQRALAGRGAEVGVPARSMDKAKDNLADVEGNVRIEAMDLADLGSVRSFADAVAATLGRLGRFGTPTVSIWLTVGLVIVCVTTFNPLNIAKLAGAFQLLLFAFNCLAVIVMREDEQLE